MKTKEWILSMDCLMDDLRNAGTVGKVLTSLEEISDDAGRFHADLEDVCGQCQRECNDIDDCCISAE